MIVAGFLWKRGQSAVTFSFSFQTMKVSRIQIKSNLSNVIIKKNVSDSRFNNVVVVKDKRTEYSKLREALVYVYKNHYKDFDWILKCNDNTYMVMENLRWLLYQYDTTWPLMIGSRVHKISEDEVCQL
jgi:hypothetical protein